MQAKARRFLLACALLSSGLTSSTSGLAEDKEPVLVTLGQWQQRNQKPTLIAALEGALTAKQKSIINGGFTTVSQLVVRELGSEADGKDDDSGRIVYKVRCSVKFDAWEETYDIARLDDQPRTALVRRLNEYGDLCLKAEITDLALLGRLAKDGGTLYAVLLVKQMSSDEAAKIKEWLIQQQSGVMQSLFSHMLGELTVNQTAKLKISVPPRPNRSTQLGPALRFGERAPQPEPPGKG